MTLSSVEAADEAAARLAERVEAAERACERQAAELQRLGELVTRQDAAITVSRAMIADLRAAIGERQQAAALLARSADDAEAFRGQALEAIDRLDARLRAAEMEIEALRSAAGRA